MINLPVKRVIRLENLILVPFTSVERFKGTARLSVGGLLPYGWPCHGRVRSRSAAGPCRAGLLEPGDRARRVRPVRRATRIRRILRPVRCGK
jgi:hypothetical protein